MKISVEEEYDNIILESIGSILHPNTVINSLEDILHLELTPRDTRIFSKLYSLKPTTKSGAKNNGGIGKGEIALYWLFKYNKTKFNVISNSKTSSKLPDLTIDKFGVEVKSFDNAYIHLGRYQQDSMFGDLLEMLNISYSLSTINEYDDVNNRVYYTTFSILPKQLNQVFANVITLRTNIDKWKDKLYGKNIQNAVIRLEQIYQQRTNSTNIPTTNIELTEFFISELIKTKLQEKPGINGYIVNVSPNGIIKSKQVTKEFLDTAEFRQNCTKYARANHGSIELNLDKIFGSSK